MKIQQFESLTRRGFLRVAGSAAIVPWYAACARDGADGGGGGETRVDAWTGYDNAIVIDGLAGPIQFNIPQEGLPLGSAAVDAVRRSGVTALNLTVNARPTEAMSAFEATNEKMSAWADEITRHPDVFRLVESAADIVDAKSAGQLGIVFGFQDGVPFEDDLDRIAAYHAQGLRIIQLTYNVENKIGSGSLVPSDSGLTDLGRQAVAHMEELGILIDLSHCGRRTTLDGIDAASGPVSITHSGCSAVYPHPRSKDDETLRLLADRGGVLGIYLMPFLNPTGAPTAADVITHIEHALNVCGEDHVGIGSDQGIVPLDVSGDFMTRFEAVSAQRAAAGIAAPREDTVPYVPELNHPRRMETIADMLMSRGHAATVVEKVLGTNFLRLFGEVWA